MLPVLAFSPGYVVHGVWLPVVQSAPDILWCSKVQRCLVTCSQRKNVPPHVRRFVRRFCRAGVSLDEEACASRLFVAS